MGQGGDAGGTGMAKRRRLTPARAGFLTAGVAAPEARVLRGPDLAAPPIARVAGDAAATAALTEVADALATARAEGRLVQRLPLDVIEVDHLVRDRLVSDEEELQGLMTSLAAHGQRTPVDVTEIAPGRYGLISGWRRITALMRLHAQTGEGRFAEVLALVRRPDSAALAYVAMVEENEVRLGLSYYERARIAAKAVDLGVFETERAALQALYAAASRARRSKIGSFLAVYRALDPVLRFPAAIPERLGLALARLVEADPAATAALVVDLAANPAPDAAAELARLTQAVEAAEAARDAVAEEGAGRAAATAPDAPRPPGRPRRTAPPGSAIAGTAPPDPGTEIRPGVFLRVEGGWTKPVLTLSGPAVDPTFRERLEQWLTRGA